MYKKPADCMYHIFSDNYDEWLIDLKKAVSIARKLARKYGCVRIYKETDWDEEVGLFTNEDCILKHGSFPW